MSATAVFWRQLASYLALALGTAYAVILAGGATTSEFEPGRWGPAAAAMVAGAVLLAWRGARRWRKALNALQSRLQECAAGRPWRRLPALPAEWTPLEETLDRTAADWEERRRELSARLEECRAMLASMPEGMLALDDEGRVLSLNQAALAGFGLERAPAPIGRPLAEIIRHHSLQRFVAETLNERERAEAEIEVSVGGQERYLQLHGAALRDGAGRKLGVLVILTDLTRLRRLEQIRRDFVANVSHELKTPITSIKGFVETLLYGAIEEPEKARRFLEIVGRHADRLNAIIDDLLSLSRIERDSDQEGIAREISPVKEILDQAAQICTVQAQAKHIRLKVVCSETLSAPLNGPLIEQAVVNLINNAVKYSPEDTEVEVLAAADRELVIQVRDHGSGIARAHLPRLFERFYRVDKARSRHLGGTGLGLAIVKHICLAHRGRVTVESELGQGSAFTLHLPLTLKEKAPAEA